MQNEYRIQAVLFDLDGVVIDSNGEIEVFWQGWATNEGVVLDKATIEKHILGRTTMETIEALFPDATEETVRRILESGKTFDAAMRPNLLNGLRPFIEQLFTSGVTIGLVTSSPKVRVGIMLAQHNIMQFFKAIVTAEDVQQGKPDPEPYLKMAAKLHVAPSLCLVFEDSNSGIVSALRAGMQVLAIGNQNFTETLGVLADYTSLVVQDHTITFDDASLRILLD